MRTIRCPLCKRMYEFDGKVAGYCPECSAEAEKEYREVREYVKQRAGVTMEEVARIFGIPHSKVIQYLREERLEISKVSQSFLRCDKCGTIIVTGIRCEDCKKRFGYA